MANSQKGARPKDKQGDTDSHPQPKSATEIRQLENLLGSIVKVLPAGVAVADAKGEVIFSNAVVRELLGGPMVGNIYCQIGPYQLLHPNGSPIPPSELPLARAIEKGEATKETEILVRREDGAVRIVLVSGSPVFDAEDHVAAAIAVLQDITERKRAEEATARLAAIVDNSEDAIISVALDGTIRTWNPAAERLYVYSAQEVLGKSLALIMPPERSHELAGNLGKVERGERVEYYDSQRITKGGRRIDVSVSVSPIRDSSGKVEGASWVALDITERKREERALQESERRLHTVVTHSPVDVFYQGQDLRYVWVAKANPPFTVDQLLGKTDFDLLPREEAERLRQIKRRVLETGIAARAEVALTFGGTTRYYDALFEPERDRAGNIVGVWGYSYEITRRKLAEQEREQLLAELDRRASELDAIIASIADGIVIDDPQGRIVRMNAAAERILGYSPADREKSLAGRAANLHITTADGQPIPYEGLPIVRALRGETVTAEITAFQSPEGKRWVAVSAAPICTHEGKLLGVVGSFTDITSTQRLLAERETLLSQLQEANARMAVSSIQAAEQAEKAERQAAELDATITSIADGLIIFAADGLVLRMNPAAEHILGLPPGEQRLSLAEWVAGLRITKADGKPISLDELPNQRALRGERVHGLVLIVHRIHDSRAVWISTSAAPIHTTEGRLLGAIVVFSDITALHELQEQQEDLLRTVSHDLRNPLTIIHGQAQLLLRMLERAGLKGPEYRSAETIVASSNRMNAMIQDLVDASRFEAGELKLERKPLSLVAFVHDLLSRNAATLAANRIKVEIPKNLPAVLADSNRLERIFINLLTNALKYSDRETSVEIAAKRIGHEVEISITDHGVGIPVQDLPHIFERFYRVGEGRKAEGVGLGLCITKMLVQTHGGRLWVESEVGRGSTFYFTLPVVRVEG